MTFNLYTLFVIFFNTSVFLTNISGFSKFSFIAFSNKEIEFKFSSLLKSKVASLNSVSSLFGILFSSIGLSNKFPIILAISSYNLLESSKILL